MHVLLLSWRDITHPQGGGSEKYIETIGTNLDARGYKVSMMTARHPGSSKVEDRDGIRFYRRGGRLTVYPHVLWRLLLIKLGLSKISKPDIIIDTQNGIPFFSSLLKVAPTILLVHHCHKKQWPVAGFLLSKIGWLIESWLSPRINHKTQYLTVSNASSADLLKLGVDTDRITIAQAGTEEIPETISLRSKTPTLVTLSRLVPHKQIEHAILAVQKIKETTPNVRLKIIGSGWWEQELNEFVIKNELQDYVEFLGFIPEQQKHEVLAQSWIHLMPSKAEGWGLAVTEAATHHVPTIGYLESKGLNDSVHNHETGILVSGLDNFIEATKNLLQDPPELERLGVNAANLAKTYTWMETTNIVESLILNVTDAKTSSILV